MSLRSILSLINFEVTVSNWHSGGKLLRTHRVPLLPLTQSSQRLPIPAAMNLPEPVPPNPPPTSAIPTSIALDSDWVVVGLGNSRIHVFSAKTGVLSRTLVGHGAGVWAVALIKGSNHSAEDAAKDHEEDGEIDDYEDADEEERRLPRTFRNALGLDSSRSRSRGRRSFGAPTYDPTSSPPSTAGPLPEPLPSDPAGSSIGWGQPNALVVSGGCDKDLRVWDVKSGYCIYVLRGHTSTIRCLKVLHHRPIAVSGSRDCTVRVWDVQRGKQIRVLEGHESSVRCLDVWGNKVVTGSYDTTCRVWDVETGECIHILRGHFHKVYSVAFDGVRIASGGIDTTVRLWDAESGCVCLHFLLHRVLTFASRVCLALLQGHTALVALLQLSPTVLVTGGSDGRVITFSLQHPSTPTHTSTPNSFSVIQKLAAILRR